MKDYVKPELSVESEQMESIYMASGGIGGEECTVVLGEVTQGTAFPGKNFKFSIIHSGEHTGDCEVTFKFNQSLDNFQMVQIGGTKVSQNDDTYVGRYSNSGPEATYFINVINPPAPSALAGLEIVSATARCV